MRFTSRSNCKLTLKPYKRVHQEVSETSDALVCADNILRNLGYSATKTMVLPEPYCTILTNLHNIFHISFSWFVVYVPGRIGAMRLYLLTTTLKIITRLGEFGILAALESAAEHWEAMNEMRIQQNMEKQDLAMTSNEMFEYWVLVSGLTTASFVFFVEMFGDRCIRFMKSFCGSKN